MSEFDNLDWTNHRERFKPSSQLIPAVDEAVSKVVGFKVLARDPRLIRLIVKWKKGKSEDSMEPDNFLADPVKVQELKEALR